MFTGYVRITSTAVALAVAAALSAARKAKGHSCITAVLQRGRLEGQSGLLERK